jgi:RNA polymerase subunit RPABC4/transcription elongation factor Spt4
LADSSRPHRVQWNHSGTYLIGFRRKGMFGEGSQGVPITSIILVFSALSIWFIVDIVKSNFSGNNKIKWILLVTFLPIAGIILYYYVGAKQKITPKTHYNCPKCRKFIPREANNCTYCGFKLAPDVIRNKPNPEIEYITKNIYNSIANISKEYIITCPYCNQSIRSDSKECPFCAMFIPEDIQRRITI